ncbi:hypothetical protein GCM10007874_69160 [Labrys miyagiensis]|uniref:N-acetyltransferase domain-containing protein n=1 Tax=Labrys miyagiensis TaxID=346912 RepID=A0ABQ6CVR8_9HYPH|nr:arsenic resistance N-acetyltransferase ArsN2 [Labrys miyagiensis]GLS23895.1 hypothetical protein GCM10007874_69160 [Labrys miyagiensis]
MPESAVLADVIITSVWSSDLSDLAATLTAAGLPADDIDEPGRTFLRFKDAAGHTVGFGGWESHGADILLRSITVASDLRGQGLGGRIVEKVLGEAHAAGASKAYLLTTSAQGFFAGQGFEVITRDAIPTSILETRQAAGLCPTSAVIMVKKLSP